MALRCMTLSSLFLLLALTGCYKGAGIEYTSPADGEENVDPNTNVVIGFSQPMDADSVTTSTNYVVRGSISGEHEITASYNSETRELTITSAGSNGGGGEDVDPEANPDGESGGSTDSPDLSDPFGPGGLLNPDGTPRTDDDPESGEGGSGSEGGGTVTGTAGDAFTFTPGETVTVELSEGITNNISVPLDAKAFSFQISGTAPSGFEPDSGEFLVASASPTPGGEAASLSPLIELTFDRPINRSSVLFQDVPGLPGFTFPQNVYVTGSLSGDQRGSVAFLGGDGDSTASAMRLTGLSFLPGESVTVSLDQQITAPNEGGGSSILRPFSYTFRIPTGHAQLPFGDVAAIQLAPEVALGRVLDIAVGDFTNLSDNGSELVVLESDGDLHLLIQSANGSYLGNSVNVITGGSAPVGMRHADLDADGNVEFLVLFADGTVIPYSVADIALEAGPALTDPFGVTARDFEVADLDGDGLLDIVMATGGGYAVLAQATTTTTTAEGVSTTERSFAALVRPIDGGFRNVAIGDIESDGRVDMILSGNSGHRIFRNASDFVFQAVGTLAVQSLDVSPLIADFEGDGDNDVVAARGTELLVFVNDGDGVPAGGNWEPGFTDTLLNSNDEPTTFRRILVVNADGDPGRLPDLVVYGNWTETERYVAFCRRASTEIGDYDHSSDGVELLSFTLENSRIVVADRNGDTGAELLFFGGNPLLGASLFERLGQGVTPVRAADFALSVPESLVVDLVGSDQEFSITVSATISGAIGDFSIALDYDEATLELQRIERDETTFPEATDVALTTQIDIDSGTGTVVGTPTIDLEIDQAPLVHYVFRFRDLTPGAYPFQLTSNLQVTNQFTLPDNTVVEATLLNAAGQVIANSTVSTVENLTCAVNTVTLPGGSSQEQVNLNWSVPAGESFDNFEIRRNGSIAITLGGSQTSWVDPNPTAQGTGVTYQVISQRDDVASAPAECSLTVLPIPVIETCERSAGQLNLAWTVSIGYSSYLIAIDGVDVALTDQTSFVIAMDNNGHLVSVTGITASGDTSPAATCVLDDLDSSVTAPVQNVQVTLDSDTANLTWVNGESYDSITIRRTHNGSTVIVTDALVGFVTAFQDEQLEPGTYSYSVSGVTGGVESVPTASNEVELDILPPFGLECLTDGNTVIVNWQLGSSFYTALDVFRNGVFIATVAPDVTTFLDETGLTDGTYEYFVRASIGGESVDSNSCTAVLENRIRVVETIAAVGTDAEIVIVGDLLNPIFGYSFTVEYDSDRFDLGAVVVPGAAPSEFTVSGPEVVAGSIVSVEVVVDSLPVSDGDGEVLARFVGSIPADFAAVGASPVSLTAAMFETFEPTRVDGTLDVRGMAAATGSYTAAPGETFNAVVLGTFDQEISSFVFVLGYDPNLLVCNEVIFSDTVTSTFGGSALFSTIDDEAGFVQGAAVSLSLDPLLPTIDQVLAFVSFTVLPGTDGMTSPLTLDVPHLFATELETSFVTSGATTVFPLAPAGSVMITGEPVPHTVTSITPTTGLSSGGADVTISGTLFSDDMTVTFGGVAATNVTFVDTETLVATSPAGSDGAVDVAVISSIATVLAPQPFTYFTPQPLTILDVTPSTVIPCVSTEVTLTGESFVSGVTVFFETDFGEFEGTVTFVSTDGTTLTVMTPELTGTDVDVTIRVDRGSESGTLSGSFAFAEDFVRGDVNGDGVVDALDFDFLSAAFSGGPMPAIADSADMNDDGFVLINDLVLLRDFVNGVLTTIPTPFPAPGPDPTADGLATGCDPAP